MGHKRRLLTCDKCNQTKAARYFKRDFKNDGYYTTCRECTGDTKPTKECVTCGKTKGIELGFTLLVLGATQATTVYSVDCKECRKTGKVPVDVKARRRGYYEADKAAKIAHLEAPPTRSIDWPWKPFKGET